MAPWRSLRGDWLPMQAPLLSEVERGRALLAARAAIDGELSIGARPVLLMGAGGECWRLRARIVGRDGNFIFEWAGGVQANRRAARSRAAPRRRGVSSRVGGNAILRDVGCGGVM